jgi:nucleoside-diphosphate-sugar epimerase
MSKKILITGGAGYIGQVLTPMLLEKGYQVVIIDKLIFGQKPYEDKKNFKFINGDVRDYTLIKKILEGNNFDVVIPLAALVGAPICSKFVSEAEEINYKSCNFLFDNLDKSTKIILPVSNSGYGIAEHDKPCTEESPLNPISVYGVTKVKSENSLIKRGNYISLRLATIFGMSPRMRLDLLVNNFVYDAITKKYLEIFEGKFKRNYVHIKDVARAFIFCIENFDKLKNNIFNFGLEDVNLTKIELAENIKKHVEGFNYVLNEFGHDPDKRDYIVSNQKILKTGFEFQYSLDRGIKELVDGIQKLEKGNYTNNLEKIDL